MVVSDGSGPSICAQSHRRLDAVLLHVKARARQLRIAPIYDGTFFSISLELTSNGFSVISTQKLTLYSDRVALAARIGTAVAEVVRKQVASGVYLVCQGEPLFMPP